MGFPRGMLFKFVCGIGVIAASFWITSVALDYWRFGQQSSQASGPLTIFAMDTARPNWMLISPSTTTVSVAGKGISLESSMPTNEYQWQTNPIRTQKNTSYTVSYEIEVTKGKMAIGVLDFINDKWITTKDISARSDTIAFTASSTDIRVILYGSSQPPTAATLSSLTIVRPPTQ
jgi:hypothetical protein